MYAAGNAADGDGGTSGDHVYTATADLARAAVGTAPPPAEPAFELGRPRPNPVRVGVVARLDVSAAAGVTVRVVDGRGRLVRRVAASGAGAVGVPTAGLAPGTYFVVADGPAGRRVQPLAVAR